MNERSPVRAAPAASSRQPWVSPRVVDLPRLTELTLATGGPGIPGGLSLGRMGGGSTVF